MNLRTLLARIIPHRAPTQKLARSVNLARSYPDCTGSLEGFWESLAETVVWCGPRLQESAPRESLRSEVLCADPPEHPDFGVVVGVLTRRREMSSGVDLRWGLAGGRLLVYFPDPDLCDGAAEAESKGYFDVHNCPPWDTWVATIEERLVTGAGGYERYIVAWVPPPFVPLADAGIAVNPEECILWLDQSSTGLSAVREP